MYFESSDDGADSGLDNALTHAMEIMVDCAKSRERVPQRIGIVLVLVPLALPIIKSVIVIWIIDMKLRRADADDRS